MHKKYRIKDRPVKVCVSCNKPIVNPKYYKSDTHTTGIKGVRSECQRLRDNEYKRSLNILRKYDHHKKPKGIFLKYCVKSERVCLKCDGKFKSLSLHNRVCEKCKAHQPDIISLRNVSLETQGMDELFDFAYQS
jgi:Zn finger protein HypA/HybF involved in hydrogenase expression